jgi:tRNA (guanine37-N1)-methyltransferase
MPMRKVCIRVERRFGEKLRVLLNELELLDNRYPITQENEHLLLPLCRDIEDKQLNELKKKITHIILVERDLDPIERKTQDLTTALQDHIPSRYMKLLPHSLDIIGEIAIVDLTDELQPYSQKIGEAIRTVNPRVTTVYAKEGSVSGKYRIRPLSLIIGKPRTKTIHVEYGIRIAIDVAKTYFSPRLGTEHNRVAKLVQPGEVILDLFTGVGPFALLFAKQHKVSVYAIDINPHAIECLQRSLKLNRLKGQVTPIVGDCRQIIQNQFLHLADRIIMNLPNEAFSYLDVAAASIKPEGGMIHYYGITSKENPVDELSTRVVDELVRLGYTASVKYSRRVRPSAPHEFQVVLDLYVSGAKTSMVI